MGNTPVVELDSTTPGAVDGRQIRALAFHGVRMEYVERVMKRHGISGGRALVVGGIRGDLPRGLARLGFTVTSLDPSPVATAMAREADGGLGLTYATAAPEALGVADGQFRLVYCADSFEVTSDLDRVVEQVSRALEPGGVLVYDTVHRTGVSRLIYLGAFQGIPMTRIVPAGRYAADRLRTPAEMAEVLSRHGLRGEEVVGFRPVSVVSLVRAVLARRRGTLSDEQIADAVQFVLDDDHAPQVTYFGAATS